ncbi:MAG: M20/M25/M40 family metallo-hydrolase [Anaerolineae bacterium]|nr:M20/M25/M40 family metallo-hydrolase [Anaerolineae bacterium]
MSALIDHLGILSNAPGISGNEIAVRRAIRPMIEQHVGGLHVDVMGNLIAHKAGDGTSPLRVLVTAHMDEVGLMVVGYTGDGELRVATVGGIPDRLLPGLTVLVGEESLPGVIGLTAIHRAGKGDLEKAPGVDQLAVDIGANSKDEAKRLAPVGTPVVFSTRFETMGTCCAGKAFDDRAGCVALIALLSGQPFPFEITGAFTVQEEVGLRGARVAAYSVDPDVAIVLEGTLADDLPKVEPDVSPTTTLGLGPAVTVKDSSYTTPPRLLRHFVEVAEAEGIPYQLKQPGVGGTDAGSIHQARAGIPTITVAVPCRYIHSPISLVRDSDLAALVRLVDIAARRITADVIRPL